MRRFETVRRGVLRFEPDRGFSLRVIAEGPGAGRYFVTTGSALGPEAYGSLLEACQGIEASAARTGWTVEWQPGVKAEQGEKACSVCGAGLGDRLSELARYPEELCPPCVLEAVDEQKRELLFTNASTPSGFLATCLETGTSSETHRCWVRGRECWADAGHLGGIVVVPVERRPRRGG